MARRAVAREASEGWWAHKGSNLGPLPCEGNALPLSYASGIRRKARRQSPRFTKVGPIGSSDQSGRIEANRSVFERKPAGNHAPCWRAREACDCRARIRSASVPPPSEAVVTATVSLAGFAGGFGAAGSGGH